MEFLHQPCLPLICIARDPGLQLRDLAVSLGATERSAYGIVADLVQAGYVGKNKGSSQSLPCRGAFAAP